MQFFEQKKLQRMRVFVSVCLYVSMSLCLYIFLSLCLFVYMSLCLYIIMSFCLFVYLFVCLFLCLYVACHSSISWTQRIQINFRKNSEHETTKKKVTLEFCDFFEKRDLHWRFARSSSNSKQTFYFVVFRLNV